MVAAAHAATALAVPVARPIVAPAGTVTLAGTVAAAVLSLDSVTCAPPAGAGPSSVAVPVELLPPVTVVGFTPSEERRTARFTMRVDRRGTPQEEAVMVAEVDAATALVVTVNGALVAPAGTVTLAGTVAAAVLSLDSVTCAPPAGAGPSSVAVPVELLPPVTVVGFTPSEERRTARFTMR